MSRAAVLFLFACSLGFTQPLAFDVASVKPTPQTLPNGRMVVGMLKPTGGPGTDDPGRIRYPAISMKFLLMNAYGVRDRQIAGPSWLDAEFYAIDATMPPSTTPDQFRAMLQTLLAERFQLKIHREMKESRDYSLVVAKNGPKMKESESAPGGDSSKRPRSMEQVQRDRATLTARERSMPELAGSLGFLLKCTVTDETKLTGKYDFTLTFSTEGLNMGPVPPPITSPGTSEPDVEVPPDVFSAVQSQLGLKLEPKRGSIEFIVVEHVEKKPAEN